VATCWASFAIASFQFDVATSLVLVMCCSN
jgi:hypothetical protein